MYKAELYGLIHNILLINQRKHQSGLSFFFYGHLSTLKAIMNHSFSWFFPPWNHFELITIFCRRNNKFIVDQILCVLHSLLIKFACWMIHEFKVHRSYMICVCVCVCVCVAYRIIVFPCVVQHWTSGSVRVVGASERALWRCAAEGFDETWVRRVAQGGGNHNPWCEIL